MIRSGLKIKSNFTMPVIKLSKQTSGKNELLNFEVTQLDLSNYFISCTGKFSLFFPAEKKTKLKLYLTSQSICRQTSQVSIESQ